MQVEDPEFDQLETSTEEIIDPDEIDLSEIDEQAETFKEKIYHSKLADRKEMHFGNKWLKKMIYFWLFIYWFGVQSGGPCSSLFRTFNIIYLYI